MPGLSAASTTGDPGDTLIVVVSGRVKVVVHSADGGAPTLTVIRPGGRRSLPLAREPGYPAGEALALAGLSIAALYAATGRCAEAFTLWAALAPLLRHEGFTEPPAEARRRHEPLRCGAKRAHSTREMISSRSAGAGGAGMDSRALNAAMSGASLPAASQARLTRSRTASTRSRSMPWTMAGISPYPPARAASQASSRVSTAAARAQRNRVYLVTAVLPTPLYTSGSTAHPPGWPGRCRPSLPFPRWLPPSAGRATCGTCR